MGELMLTNARELVRTVGGGLTGTEGIIAATSDAAAALGLDDPGEIRPRSVADLLIVEGEPLPATPSPRSGDED
jgi:imidazolonepropionase-like amidohydrolase